MAEQGEGELMDSNAKTKLIADALEDAADLLERGGWIQNEYSNARGEHCVVGALGVVADRQDRNTVHADRFRYYLIEMVQNVIPPEEQISGATIVDWNDMPGRTQQEVIDTVRLAAKRALG